MKSKLCFRSCFKFRKTIETVGLTILFQIEIVFYRKILKIKFSISSIQQIDKYLYITKPVHCMKAISCLSCSISVHRGIYRSSQPQVFLGKSVLKKCSKFTGEHPCRRGISIKLQSNFIEIALRHGCSPINMLHIFRTPFS